jgi:SAM-dependent methyltransferase
MTSGGDTFNEVPELYHRMRPRYPDALFDALLSLTGVGPGGRVLEIGAGTGIATRPLAERGVSIVALEPGAKLAAVAQRELAGFVNVRQEIVPFERWALPAERFDLVFAATAFHWLDPAVRYRKTAKALRPGGYLAIVRYEHVAGGDHAFFERVQRCYEQFMPGTPPDLRLPDPHEPVDTADLASAALYDVPVIRDWLVEEVYSRGQYLDLLSTYSGHRLLDEGNRTRLFHCIGSLIDTGFGGRIRKCYRHDLIVARKR